MGIMILSGLVWNDSKRIMDELKEYLSYNPETGHFVWIKDYYINKIGSSPKPTHSEGYLRVQFKGVRIFLHKVAFYWEHGYVPDEVDHRDRDTSNNRIKNLRPATQQQNSCNKSSRGKSKYRGVYYHTNTGKWCASGRKFGKGYYLGIYKTEIEAAKAYNIWAKEAHGEYANLNGV